MSILYIFLIQQYKMAIIMKSKLIFIVLFYLLTGCFLGSSDVFAEAASTETQAQQLEINKTTLISDGSTEQNRVNAAVLLLLSTDKQAKAILLEVLAVKTNPVARVAVCQALKQSRTLEESIKSKDDFFEPLFLMLSEGNALEGKSAADAMLIYDYKKIAYRLKLIIDDPKSTEQIKLNAIYAIKIRPDKDAILDLIKLLNNSDSAVAREVEGSLEKILGVPIGASKSEWDRISGELVKKSRDEFIADRLVMQYDKIRQLEEEFAEWKNLYKSGLDKFYEQTIDDSAKEKFLIDQLGSSKNEIKVWAITKVTGWKTSGKPVPDLLSREILKLINSDNRSIRLETAQLVAGFGSIAPTEQILNQFKVETDPVVRIEQFKALGEVIYYGLLPGSNLKVPNEIRIETLDIAGGYLDSTDLDSVITAARVIRKLLDQNGLENTIAQKYFSLILKRYEAIDPNQEGKRSEIVSVMSKLCQEGSHYRVDAVNIFGKSFEAGLADSLGLVRGASVVGIENIGQAEAIKIFRERKLYDDSVDSIRLNIFQLAEKAGGSEDMEWLSGKMNNNGDAEPAWKAFLAIITRGSFEQMLSWTERLSAGNINSNYKTQLLLAVESKAVQGNLAIPANLKLALADVYEQSGDFDKSIGYLNDYIGQSGTNDSLKATLTRVYLKKQDIANAIVIIESLIKEKDITPDNSICGVIEAFMKDPAANPDQKNALIAGLAIIPAPERPSWAELLKSWSAPTN